MAVTLTKFPPNVAMAGEDLIFMASSTNSSEPNFKFIVQVYQGGSEIAKYYIPANPAGRLLFNAKSIAQSKLKTPVENQNNGVIHNNTTWFSRSSSGSDQFEFRFGEYYGTNPTEYLNLTSTTRILWSGYSLSKELLHVDFTLPLAHGSNVDKTNCPFLTERVRGYVDNGGLQEVGKNLVNPWNSGVPFSEDSIQIDVLSTDDGVLSFMNDTFFEMVGASFDTDGIEIKFYDVVDVELSSFYVALSAANGTRTPSDSTDFDGKVCHINAYPANDLINALLGAFTSTTWYTIQLVAQDDPDNEPTSLPVRFNLIDSISCKNTPVRLAWTNRWGGWEYEWFDGRVNKQYTSDKKTYRKLRGDYTGTDIDYNSWDAGETVFFNDGTEVWELRKSNTDFPMRHFLRTLIQSEQVHLYENGVWIPVVVEDKSFKEEAVISKNVDVTFKVKAANYVNA